MIRRAPKVARFAGKLVTTRLANALCKEGITTLAQVEHQLRSGRFRYINNIGAKCEMEAMELVGLKDKTRHIKVCAFCGDEHICKPALKPLEYVR